MREIDPPCLNMTPSKSPRRSAIGTICSVPVAQACRDHIRVKAVKGNIRVQGRVLVVEGEPQIAPNFIIECRTRHPASIQSVKALVVAARVTKRARRSTTAAKVHKWFVGEPWSEN